MKVISLLSGGLDSQLAICVLKEQGLEVLAVNFVTPFFAAKASTIQAAEQLQVELHTIDISDVYMEKVLRNPVYGYGKNLNPCIDCHAFMLKTAGEYMDKIGASFLATGEVLGQRPMSQNKSSLQVVEKLAGYQGLIVRPLSARLLPPTIPEQEGWIDRECLLDISGRSRKRQMDLARHYGIEDYPSPAGGCLLTDKGFSQRLVKLLENNPDPMTPQIEILKVGRHFYLDGNTLLVIGRNHSENERIMELVGEEDLILKVADRPGPLSLLRGPVEKQTDYLQYAAALTARYSDARDDARAEVIVLDAFEVEKYSLDVEPLKPDQVPNLS
ncbi:MAG TPA: tRNA 4-thiouridine(8) synthase ThiI [Syntrophomonadaceae bacterium]|nr:tRNA 4-thiouridine(8) synthase ThiI [Syntrophomonadaceae bacterium]